MKSCVQSDFMTSISLSRVLSSVVLAGSLIDDFSSSWINTPLGSWALSDPSSARMSTDTS